MKTKSIKPSLLSVIKLVALRGIFLMSALFFFTLVTYAQVTIGLGEEPVKGALLQLKEKENVLDDSHNSYRGFGVPRVALSDKKQLYPMFLADPEDPTSGANADYTANKQALDKTHTGLMVYNLNEDDDKELCLGLNQWDGKQWNCFQQKIGNAIAHITDCDDITFSGLYFNNVALNSGNYMSIKLEVTKAGAYTITARAAYAGDHSQDNGYYFTTTGVFLTAGTYSLQVPGSGTPLQYTPTTPPGNPGDVITITMNDKVLTLGDGTTVCSKNIIIEDSSKKPEYSMICNQTKVNGVYQLDKELDGTNYINIVLDVDPLAAGATYLIETDKVDGIYFKGQGILGTGGSQIVRLDGYGIPNSIEDKEFTITSNSSQTTATCKVRVSVALATKKTYGWGYYNNTAGYIMQILNGVKQGTRAIVDADINFGTNENSKVKIVKYSPTQTFNHSVLSGELMAGAAYDPVQVKAMFDQKPEIVLVGFDLAISATNRTTIAGYMVDYLKAGGVLILPLERDYMAKPFFEALYPGITVTPTGLQDTPTYQMAFMNDEILNGPFGDIRGLFWGNDTHGTISVSGLPEEDLIVYSRDSSGRPTMFKHKYYNLFWCGDGGVFANFSGWADPGGRNGSSQHYPVAFNSSYVPITRTGWTGGDVENSRLFANVMAWAVRQAQFNGINTR